MAEHLASIFGTEKDRVNCPFYFKIGACRHGDRCSRLHNRPTISPTLLLHNLYMNPVLNTPLGPDGLPLPVDAKKVQEFFQDFYEDIFEELARFGEIEYLNVCDNLADHMVGNVYAKFRDEEAAARALQGLQGRYYAGKPIQVEFSPVTDFREATCRQYEEGTCGRGGYCNFMHVRPVSKDLRKHLFGRYKNGTGGSTRFHDNDGPARGGRDSYRSGGGGSRYDDRRGGGNRYDDRRGRDRYDDRGRRSNRYDDDSRRGGGRESSAERRARIAQWNSDFAPAAPAAAPTAPPGDYNQYAGGASTGYGAAGGGGGYPAMNGGGGYGAPPPPGPPAGHYNGSSGGGGGYNNRGGGRGGSSGGGSGGSGANTIPIGQPRYQPQ